MIASVRLVLAVLALVITYIDPTEPSRLQAATYAGLIAYVVGSAVAYAASRNLVPVLGRLRQETYWVDVAFYIVLIALSGGSNSVFFVLIFFAILAAAFRDGFREGIKITSVCFGLFVVISICEAPRDPVFDLNRFLIQSSMLPTIGYLMSYWGGRQVQQMRGLGFLNELGHLANPRLDIDRILALVTDRLCKFFSADCCVVITSSETREPPVLRCFCAETNGSPRAAETATEAIAAPLLGLDPDALVVYCARGLFGRDPQLTVVGRPQRDGEAQAHDINRAGAAADLLEARSFISVPLRLTPAGKGRLYVVRRRRAFIPDDAEFLKLAIEQFEPTLQHVALIDRVATQVIEDERRRIALDIHDQVIQPYIGLQFGLTALTQLLESPAGDEPFAAAQQHAQKLMTLTRDGIADLRNYVSRLRQTSTDSSIGAPTLKRFAERFSQATGIDVELNLADDLETNNVVTEAAFPIVVEALSNIRRHTVASRAVVTLGLPNGRLHIQVENPVDPDATPEAFVPKSISERVAAVGGSVRVEPHRHGRTCLNVEIPLQAAR